MDIEQCKEAYEMLKKSNQFVANIDKDFFLSFAETVLSELKKKKVIINEMAKYMAGGNSFMYATKEQIIEEFTNKVEKEGK